MKLALGEAEDREVSVGEIAPFGLVLTVVIGAACALGVMIGLDLDALLVIAALPVLPVTWLDRHRLGLERASVLAFAAALPVTLICGMMFREHVIRAHWHKLSPEWATFALPELFVPSFLFTAFVVLVLTQIPLRARAVAARALGCLALVAAIVTSALGIAKRTSHPDIAGLRATIEEIGSLRGTDPATSSGPATPFVFGPLHLTASSDPVTGCTIHIKDGDGADGAITVHPPSYVAKAGCEQLQLFHVPPARLWIATNRKELGPSLPLGFVSPSLQSHRATWDALARQLGPSWGSIASALFGVALAGASLLRRDRALEERLTWREEEHAGTTRLVSPRAREAGYRGSPDEVDPAFVMAGSLAALRAQRMRARTGRWAFVTLIVALTAAPLFVAAALGFVT
jgi:hypothetical protein